MPKTIYGDILTQALRVVAHVLRFILITLVVPFDISNDGIILAKEAENNVSFTEAPEFNVQLLSHKNDCMPTGETTGLERVPEIVRFVSIVLIASFGICVTRFAV